MAAYLEIVVEGNESFGGYLSFDGDSSVELQDGMLYEISPGMHNFVINSNSDSKRKMGGFQKALYNNTSSSGALFDALERKSIVSNLGDSWEIDEYVGENQEFVLYIHSNGDKIIGSPSYNVIDLDDEYIQKYETHFAEIRAEEERIANTPRRSTKMIVWGCIVAFLGLFGFYNFARGGDAAFEEYGYGGYAVMLAIIVAGALLIFFGSKKKVRK